MDVIWGGRINVIGEGQKYQPKSVQAFKLFGFFFFFLLICVLFYITA